MSQPPKSPFNLSSGAWGNDKQNDQTQDQGPDKDNAAFRFDPPNHGQNPAPNLAPPGMSAGSGKSGPERDNDDQEQDSDNEIHIIFKPEGTGSSRKVDTTSDHETTDGVLPDGNNFLVKQVTEVDFRGEEVKKISRLSIFDDNKEGIEFKDGDWIIPPKTELENDNVQKLQDMFGQLDHQKFKSFEDISQDQERDHEI